MTEPEERQARSHRRLRRAGAKVNPWLPLLESEAEARCREPVEVAHRILCLVFVSAWASEDLDNQELQKWALQEPFCKTFTANEQAFLSARNPSRRDRIWMGWQIEAALALVWAITPKIRLGLNLGQRRPWEVLKRVPRMGVSTSRFIEKARVRPTREILDETDLIYRAHWAARDALNHKRRLPRGWEYEVIQERHRALNWLTRYGTYDDEDTWDLVTTDT
jgi:hypothetical protein